MLHVRDLTVQFDGRPVLHELTLHVAAGDVVALLGPSGAGKSTLLRVIAGLLAPDSGSVWVNGRDVTTEPAHRRHIGMVFQDEQLFPHMSVAANVGFGLRMQRLGRPDVARRVAQALDMVGLGDLGDRRVTTLSGGEAKRVALARSLVPRPLVLLLDEPLTGLDRDLHDRLADDVAEWLRSTRTTTLLVTHDPSEANTIAHHTLHWPTLQPRCT